MGWRRVSWYAADGMSRQHQGDLGFGIIGAGNIARLHAQAIRALEAPAGAGVKLRAFLASTPARVGPLAAQYGVDGLTDASAFFARPDIHVVTICTPSGTHADLGVQAAQAGKHVIVEKPIDVTLPAAQRLIDACEQAGVHLGVIFQSRFLPAVALIKRAIERGRLGRLYLVDAYVKWFRAPAYYQAARWRGTKALDGGGALINQAIHTVDLAQYFAGPVASVFGYTDRKHHPAIESEDTALALVQYRSGAAGVIEATTSVSPGFSRRVELHGERGSVVLDGNDISFWQLEGQGEEEVTLAQLRAGAKDASDGASNPMNLDIAGHQQQLEDFVEAVRTGRAPAIDGREGLRALRIVLAVYASAAAGEKVELPPES
jgi:UDP-N-acetyl-2-amino-2-deoxyglucuronate dehydrogenase